MVLTLFDYSNMTGFPVKELEQVGTLRKRYHYKGEWHDEMSLGVLKDS